MKIELTHDQWLQVMSAVNHRIWDLQPIDEAYGPTSLTRQAYEECKSIKAHLERTIAADAAHLEGNEIAD